MHMHEAGYMRPPIFSALATPESCIKRPGQIQMTDFHIIVGFWWCCVVIKKTCVRRTKKNWRYFILGRPREEMWVIFRYHSNIFMVNLGEIIENYPVKYWIGGLIYMRYVPYSLIQWTPTPNLLCLSLASMTFGKDDEDFTRLFVISL
jgi:hypothetical protein